MSAGKRQRTAPVTVVCDPEAVLDLESIKGKDYRKAIVNAVDKLRRLGAQLAPPHVKLLKGEVDLVELARASGTICGPAALPPLRRPVRDPRHRPQVRLR